MSTNRMRINVKISGMEFVIPCGTGWQDLIWLARTASISYGQKHHPKGVYVPCLLETESRVPHPRRKIRDVLKDGETVEVTLKNGTREMSAQEEYWYSRAFGRSHNMVNLVWSYAPKGIIDNLKNHDIKLFVRVHYKMYPELAQEFKGHDYKPVFDLELRKSSEAWTYTTTVDLPYGDIKGELVWESAQVASQNAGEEENVDAVERRQKMDRQEEQDSLFMHPDIEPISMAIEQRKINEEENELKKQEDRLREEQQREREQEKMMAQSQNLAEMIAVPTKLENLWEDIDTQWINDPEEIHNCMTMLNVFYQDIYEIFQFYTFLHPQPTEDPALHQITVQDLLHFLKTCEFFPDVDALHKILEDLESLLPIPYTDDMNLDEGLNFAQFIESLLRYSAWKLAQVPAASQDETEGLSQALQGTLQECILTNKNSIAEDQFKSEFRLDEILEIYRTEYDCFSALFKGTAGTNSILRYRELNRDRVRHMMRGLGIMKEENMSEEILEKMVDDVLSIGTQSYEHLFYCDLLELFFRVGFFVVNDDNLPTPLDRLGVFTDRLAPKVDEFISKLEASRQNTDQKLRENIESSPPTCEF